MDQERARATDAKNALPARLDATRRAPRRSLVAAALQRRALIALKKRLGGSWRVLGEHRLLADHGECLVDYILLHEEHGVMLVLVDRGIYAAPGIAIEVMEDVLRGIGFGNTFHGHLPVNCVAIERAQLAALPGQLDEAFAGAAPVEVPEPDWVMWLDGALLPYRSTATKHSARWSSGETSQEQPQRASGRGLGLRDAVVAASAILIFGGGLAMGMILLGKESVVPLAAIYAAAPPQDQRAAAMPLKIGSGASDTSGTPQSAPDTATRGVEAASLPSLTIKDASRALPALGAPSTETNAREIASDATVRPHPTQITATPSDRPRVDTGNPAEILDPIEPPRPRAKPKAPISSARSGECRAYTAERATSGRAAPVQGIACRQADGKWRLMSERPG